MAKRIELARASACLGNAINMRDFGFWFYDKNKNNRPLTTLGAVDFVLMHALLGSDDSTVPDRALLFQQVTAMVESGRRTSSTNSYMISFLFSRRIEELFEI